MGFIITRGKMINGYTEKGRQEYAKLIESMKGRKRDKKGELEEVISKNE